MNTENKIQKIFYNHKDKFDANDSNSHWRWGFCYSDNYRSVEHDETIAGLSQEGTVIREQFSRGEVDAFRDQLKDSDRMVRCKHSLDSGMTLYFYRVKH